MKCSKRRWLQAQKKEKRAWDTTSTKEIKRTLNNYAFLSDEFNWTNASTKILDVGCSKLCSAVFIKGEKTGIDTIPYPGTPFKAIKGNIETFTSKEKYDVIVATNMLDHCQNPDKALSNMKSLLKDDGVIFISLNTYSYIASFLLTFIEKNTLPFRQIAHPHIYSERKIKRQLQKYFKIQNKIKIKTTPMFKKGLFYYFLKTFSPKRKIVVEIGFICKKKIYS